MNKRLWQLSAAIFLVCATIVFSSWRRVQASSTQIKQFYANCSVFSVDVDVAGVSDDGNGLDRFQYKITDGSGTLLYQENAARHVGQLGINLVMNVPYDLAKPAKNPATLSVVDLDAAGNPGHVLRTANYDASCLSPSGKGDYSGIFAVPESFKLVIRADTAFYAQPGGSAVALYTHMGEMWTGIYRTADNQWIGVYANSNELMWLPNHVTDGPYNLLPVRPTRIEHTVPDGVPTGTTVTPLGITILRSAPSADSANVGHIDAPSIWAVTGRNAAGDWIQIDYNGTQRWVSAYHACLMNG